MQEAQTWGVAFEIHGHEEVSRVIGSLHTRETLNGGYITRSTTFYPRESPPDETVEDSWGLHQDRSLEALDSISGDDNFKALKTDFCDSTPIEHDGSQTIQVIFYTATPDNDLYLGPDTTENMARQIIGANGSAGTNVEYVVKTAEYLRMFIPEDDDTDLFHLDAKIRELIYLAQARDTERVRLSLSDISHGHFLEPKRLAGIAKAS